MIPDSLNAFLKSLYEHDLLQRISEPVDPDLEMAAIVDRVCKRCIPNKALLFDHVKDSLLPVAVNLFGSHKRMSMALGADNIDILSDKFSADLESVGGASSSEALTRLVAQSVVEHELVSSPLWQAEDFTSDGLSALPTLKSWPLDGGRYITLGQVFTRSVESPQQNCGMYRIQVIDNHTALLKCHPGAGAVTHLKGWHKQDKDMPVVVVLGGPPALTWASGISIPEDISELDFVHSLTGSSIPLSQASTTTLKIPATAEIVIEGTISPGEEMLEGPFGNHTGNYASPTPAPIIKITSVKMKTDATYPCTVVGPPPMENSFMAVAAERILLKLLQYDFPWVSDVHMPVEGIYHRAAMVTVVSQAPLSTDEIQRALLSSQLLRRSRLLILLDEGTDTANFQQVYWHVINKMNCTSHADGVVIDARSSEGTVKVLQNPAIDALVSDRWSRYGL